MSILHSIRGWILVAWIMGPLPPPFWDHSGRIFAPTGPARNPVKPGKAGQCNSIHFDFNHSPTLIEIAVETHLVEIETQQSTWQFPSMEPRHPSGAVGTKEAAMDYQHCHQTHALLTVQITRRDQWDSSPSINPAPAGNRLPCRLNMA